MRPDDVTKELTVFSLHPGVTREQVQANTGWPVRFATDVGVTAPPTTAELETLRDLQRRTELAHAGAPAAGAA
jgi:glutaconate CoA-transferase subunit B